MVDETGMIQKGKNKASNQKSIERGWEQWQEGLNLGMSASLKKCGGQ